MSDVARQCVANRRDTAVSGRTVTGDMGMAAPIDSSTVHRRHPDEDMATEHVGTAEATVSVMATERALK